MAFEEETEKKRLRPEKEAELRSELRKKGWRTNAAIAKNTFMTPSSLTRMLNGETVGDSDDSRLNLRRLCAKLVNVPPAGNDPAEIEKRKEIVNEEIERLIAVYFEPVERKKVERKKTVNVAVPEASSGAALSCLVAYIKLIHLRDERNRNSPPVYRRNFRSEEIPVYDEFLTVHTFYYKAPTPNILLLGRRIGGLIDVQPIFPPHTTIPDNFLEEADSPSIHAHLETTATQLCQGVFPAFNSFQYEQINQPGQPKSSRKKKSYYHVGVFQRVDCDRCVMVVDFTSLPVKQEDLLIDPRALHIRPTADGKTELKLGYEKSHLGMFIIDTAKASAETNDAETWKPDRDKLLANDAIEFRFLINWDAVNAQFKKP